MIQIWILNWAKYIFATYNTASIVQVSNLILPWNCSVWNFGGRTRLRTRQWFSAYNTSSVKIHSDRQNLLLRITRVQNMQQISVSVGAQFDWWIVIRGKSPWTSDSRSIWCRKYYTLSVYRTESSITAKVLYAVNYIEISDLWKEVLCAAKDIVFPDLTNGSVISKYPTYE